MRLVFSFVLFFTLMVISRGIPLPRKSSYVKRSPSSSYEVKDEGTGETRSWVFAPFLGLNSGTK